MSHDSLHDDVISPGRIEALSDGIFAIVMTILIFEIKIPDQASIDAAGSLPQALWHLAPHFGAYFMSFIILGIFWIAHHLQFHYIKHSSRPLMWINIIFFMFIALIPFSAGLLGRFPNAESAIILYGANLLMCSLIIYTQWHYATSNFRLVHDDINRKLVHDAKKYMLISPLLYLLAMAVSLYNPKVSLGIYAFITLFYILPSRLDRYLPGGHRK